MNEEQDAKDIVKKIKLGLIGVALFIAFIIVITHFPIVTVGAGQRGVVFNNGTGVENRILSEGTHWRTPFIEDVHTMSVRVQKSDFTEDAASRDLQRITMVVVVNWQVNPSRVNRIYQEVGDMDTIVATVLNPRVQQAVKAETSLYSAEEVQKNRDKLVDKIQVNLTKKLKGYDIFISNVAIANLNYTAEFNQVIEQKQVAQQEAEKAGYLKQKAENEASAHIAEANGNASAVKINADAEAYKQDKLQQTLTPLLLQKALISKWNGEYPKYMLGNSMQLLQLPQ